MSKKMSKNVVLVMLVGIISGILYRNLGLSNFFSLDLLEAIGIIFVKVIKGIVPVLIFFSISSSVLSITNMKKARNMLRLSFISFIGLTVFAICIAMFFGTIIKPGQNIDKSVFATSGKLINHVKTKATGKMSAIDFFVDLFPGNLVQDFSDGNFLHIIFFAVMFSYAILKLKRQDGSIANAIKDLEEIMIKVTEIIMHTSPVVIFCLAFWLSGTQDVVILKGLGRLIFCVAASSLFLVYFGYSLISILILKLNPLPFFKKILPAQLTGAVLTSTSSVLPVTMNISKNKMGVSKQKTEFVIPLGATVNMNGGAIYYVCVVLFTSQVFNIEMHLVDYLRLGIMSLIMAIGTAPVPGSGIVFVSGILANLGMPLEVVPVIIAIDRILDSIRTFTNISGDAFSGLMVDKLDGTLNVNEYYSKAHDEEDDL